MSGEGGQGIVLAGVILAEAAAIYDDKNATQTQVYGPESRGGASKAEVIISDEEIDYPKAMVANIVSLGVIAGLSKVVSREGRRPRTILLRTRGRRSGSTNFTSLSDHLSRSAFSHNIPLPRPPQLRLLANPRQCEAESRIRMLWGASWSGS